MRRLILAAGCSLLVLPQSVPAKPKPPAISACYRTLCLNGLRWFEPESGALLPSILGQFHNGSSSTLTNVSVSFSMRTGPVLVNTATDSFLGDVPPGGSWNFSAVFVPVHGQAILTET